MSFLTGWTYRRYFTVVRDAGVEAETNYPVPIRVGESSGASDFDLHCVGKCKSDFSDLRFTTADGDTTMPLWIESISGTSPNQTAIIWVKYPSVGENSTTAYLYYGNPEAEGVSDGAEVFQFFSDFSAAPLDTSQWTATLEGNGTAAVSGGVLRLNCPDGATNRAKVTSTTEFSYNTAIRFRMRYKKFGASKANLRIGYLKDSPAVNRLHFYSNENSRSVIAWSSYKNGAGSLTNDNPFTSDVFAIVDMIRSSSKSVYKFNGTVKATHTTNVPDGTLPIVFDSDNDQSGAAWYIELDWLAVRKYADGEPLFGDWGREEENGVTYNSCWTIEGLPHTGEVITVGPSGRDFVHPQDAYAAASTGALLLVYPGTYDLKFAGDPDWIFKTWNKRVYIRGLGDNADDTIFINSVNFSSGSFLFCFAVVENITVIHNSNRPWSTTVGFAHSFAATIFSKCHLAVSGVYENQYVLLSLWVTTHDGYVKFRFCKLTRGNYRHFSGQDSNTYALDLSKIYLDKCETNGALLLQYYKNALALADYVTSPAAGYGYDAGDFIIMPCILQVSTQAPSNITSISFQANGTIDDEGLLPVTRRGFCYMPGTSGEPTIADSVVDETGDFDPGSFSLPVSELTRDVNYRVRAFVENTDGIIYGAPTFTVTTLKSSPTVATGKPVDVLSMSATFSGTLLDTGGQDAFRRGFCYVQAALAEPTVADTVAALTGTFGAGGFSQRVSGLAQGKPYRVRAFAENTLGVGYGATQSFTTQDPSPSDAIRLCRVCEAMFMEDPALTIGEVSCPQCGSKMDEGQQKAKR